MQDITTGEAPQIPNKRYFTIGEVSQLFSIEPHVLRYWEQEFPELAPVRRRGKRRYYTRQEVDLISKIIYLLYRMEFTISGARKQLNQLKKKKTKNKSESPPEMQEVIAGLNKALEVLSSDN